jgi:hypothetical protein
MQEPLLKLLFGPVKLCPDVIPATKKWTKAEASLRAVAISAGCCLRLLWAGLNPARFSALVQELRLIRTDHAHQ